MAIVTISDPSGSRKIKNLFDGDWLFAPITHYSNVRMTTEDTLGNIFTLHGHLPATDTSNWTLSGISISQGHNFRAELSLLDITYNAYESALSVFDIIFSGDDRVTSDSPNAFHWKLDKGDDTINAGSGDDTIDGGAGLDTLVIDSSIKKARYYLNIDDPVFDTADGLDTVLGVEFIEFNNRRVSLVAGSFGDNTLRGNQHKDVTRQDIMLGGDGEDRILGNSGRDTLQGGYGHDTLKGGSGSDRLRGGFDDDLLIGGSGNDKLFGQKGNDTLVGGRHTDVFVFHKGDGNDTIRDFGVGQDLISIGRGAKRLEDLNFEATGADVLVSFANVTILVKDTSLDALNSADNFLF